MSFEALATLGALALVTGAVSCLVYYLRPLLAGLILWAFGPAYRRSGARP